MKKSLKSLFLNTRGLAMIEFALFLPLLLLMFYGAVEFTRYVVVTQKVERSAYVLSNITNQFTPLKHDAVKTEASAENLDSEVFAQFSRTMDIYNNDSDRISIISSITKTSLANDNASVKINWQRAGGGSLSSPEAVSLLNGVNASAVNSSSSPNGSTAGTAPSFPSFNGQLMHNALSDMRVGENMIITETFYRYQPFISNMLSAFGMASMPSAIMKSVVFTRPRNGDIDTLKRPDADTGTGTTPNGSTTDSCVTIALQPPYRSCSSTIDRTVGCTVTTKCTTCTHKKICKKCETPFNGNTTCTVDLEQNQNCTNSESTRACSTGGSTTPTTTPPSSQPPS